MDRQTARPEHEMESEEKNTPCVVHGDLVSGNSEHFLPSLAYWEQKYSSLDGALILSGCGLDAFSIEARHRQIEI